MKINESPKKTERKIIDNILRILCLLLPIIFAFIGFFVAPLIWPIFNSLKSAPEYFSFICSIIFFLIPTIIIFAKSRNLNPVIKITITDENKKTSLADSTKEVFFDN